MTNIYNALTKKCQQISKDTSGKDPIYWYVCGPTVYDYSHLGHARTYLSVDIMRRILSRNHKVILIMNITDIDDKIINRAKETGIDWYSLSREYETKFFSDMSQLDVQKPNIITRVSDYIPEIISFITVLIAKGYAYAVNGSVYYDVHKYVKNGGVYNFRAFTVDEDTPNTQPHADDMIESNEKLQEKPVLEPPEVEKLQTKEPPEVEKLHKEDFALWKGVKPIEGEDHSWDSPWGKGRPGWHIECSTMAINVLRQLNGSGTMTIHSGGIDLAFPHHENEIIQSDTYLDFMSVSQDASEKSDINTHNKKWVEIFSHIGHLHIDGQKMAKSLKNFIKIKDFLTINNYNGKVLRMMMLLTHYRQTLSYSTDYADYAKGVLTKIENYFTHFSSVARSHHKFNADKAEIDQVNGLEVSIESAINNDVDTVSAIGSIIRLIEMGYTTSNFYIKQCIYEVITKYYTLFGFNWSVPGVTTEMSGNQNEYVNILLKIRDEVRSLAKTEKNKALFALSDKIRDNYLKSLKIQDVDYKQIK